MDELIDPILDSGAEVDVKINGDVVVRVNAENKIVGVEVLKPEAIGRIFKKEMTDQVAGKYSKIKKLCEDIAKRGYRVKINYNGETLAEIGKGVSAWMFGVAGPIEVDDTEALFELARKMNLL